MPALRLWLSRDAERAAATAAATAVAAAASAAAMVATVDDAWKSFMRPVYSALRSVSVPAEATSAYNALLSSLQASARGSGDVEISTRSNGDGGAVRVRVESLRAWLADVCVERVPWPLPDALLHMWDLREDGREGGDDGQGSVAAGRVARFLAGEVREGARVVARRGDGEREGASMGRIEEDRGDGTYVVRFEGEDLELAGLEGTYKADHCAGVYRRLGGWVVNDRPVWQKQGGGTECFVYYANSGKWWVGEREDMEIGKAKGWVHSQVTPAEVPFGDDLIWQVDDGSDWMDWPSARCVSLGQPSGTCAATVVCGECAASPPPRVHCGVSHPCCAGRIRVLGCGSIALAY